MAETNSTQETTEATSFANQQVANILVPHPSTYDTFKNHSLQITQHKLNGTNFRHWFQSVFLVLKGKGKFGFAVGTIPMPLATDPQFSTRDAENSIFMAWLINSTKPKIGQLGELTCCIRLPKVISNSKVKSLTLLHVN